MQEQLSSNRWLLGLKSTESNDVIESLNRVKRSLS